MKSDPADEEVAIMREVRDLMIGCGVIAIVLVALIVLGYLIF